MIQIDNLDFSYSKKTQLFQQLDLQLEAGKIYGLLGKNGTGKSTILKLMVGLLFPNIGTITLNSPSTNTALQPKDRPVALLQDIFFLPEQFQYPPVSANIFIKMESAFYPKFDHQLLGKLIEEFDIPTITKLNKLSYGQQKKFMIAFGLACNTTFLFMDEPTNGLDIPSKGQFRKAVASNLSEQQVVVISTHQIRDIDKLIDSIIVLENGKVIFKSDIAEIEQKVSFVHGRDKTQREDVIYAEKLLGGFVSLIPNTDNSISEVELEVLFNALSSNKETVTQLFK